MSQYTDVDGDGRDASSKIAKDTFIALLRSLSRRVHPYFWDVNGSIDQCDSLCHFLHIKDHSDYLVLLENCGVGTSITKACEAQLASLVGKDSSKFSEYTVYQHPVTYALDPKTKILTKL
jgi:hypothetical protein